MKKLFLSIFAVAALFSCSKSDVIYVEEQSEIGFAPVARTITRAALGVEDNTYPTTQNIGVWSNYDGTVAANSTVDYATQFTTKFIEDKQFTYHTDVTPNSWAGVTAYFWPTNGSLVFAGYSMTAPETSGAEAPAVGVSRSYNFSTDEMKINGYTQSLDPATTFDLLWFGRTNKSYNLRGQSTAVPVVFNHALSWITIKVIGEGIVLDPNNTWKVTSVVINDIKDKGDVTMVGAGANQATWDENSLTDSDNVTTNNIITVWSGSQELEDEAKKIENTDYGTLVIPQAPTTATVKYKYNTPAGIEIEETTTVNLTLTGATTPVKDEDGNITNQAIASTHTKWQSGTHYIYTLKFTQSEILISATVDGWTEVNQNVSVN